MTNPNNAASIRQRLLNLAKQRSEDFQQILVHYALERLLYRLAVSPYREQFVLKGALLFRLWFDLQQRPTRDADFLGFGSAEPEHLASVFQAIAGLPLTDAAADGLIFLADTVKAEPIRKEAGYPGVRIILEAKLAEARIPVQCDVGFGDAVVPEPSQQNFPTLLELPAPNLRVYPLETVIAEKLEAIIKLAEFNSRMKDYFDLWVLMQFEQIDVAQLPAAIFSTFQRRQTSFPTDVPSGFSAEFAAQKQSLWNAFLKRSRLDAPDFAQVVSDLYAYYQPLLHAAAKSRRQD